MNEIIKEYNLIADIAFSDHHKALTMLGETDKEYGVIEDLVYIRSVLLDHIMGIRVSSLYTKTDYSEKDIQDYFFKNLDTFLPGAKKIIHKKTKGHLPDGFIKINGVVFPVEVKKDVFTRKNMEQLQWYMRVYDLKGGVAVAQKLRCSLPENIKFIEVRLPLQDRK